VFSVICTHCNSVSVVPVSLDNSGDNYLCPCCNQTSYFPKNAESIVLPENETDYQIVIGKGEKAHYAMVKGTPFIIAGYEEFKFFCRKVEGLFVISEITSGLKIGESYHTIEDAQQGIRRLINETGASNLKRIVMNYAMSGFISSEEKINYG
jgi:hypothetical protein